MMQAVRCRMLVQFIWLVRQLTFWGGWVPFFGLRTPEFVVVVGGGGEIWLLASWGEREREREREKGNIFTCLTGRNNYD